jgi:Fis family transcriptional regulator
MTNHIERSAYHQIENVSPSLRECVQRLVQRHLATMGAKHTTNLYELVSQEMEQALIERVLDYTDDNESRTAKILGISRGTLRQRRKLFGHYEKLEEF